MLAEKIYSILTSSQNILLISHKKPDGDTAGALGALYLHLTSLQKNVDAFCVDSLPPNLTFLIPINPYNNDKTGLDLNKYDTIVALDCGEMKQTGIEDLLQARDRHTRLINIDHHFTNNDYGDINLVNPEASSTSEIMYEFLKKSQATITRDMANCLLTGILTDTTYFSNGATTIDSVKYASELMARGANMNKITLNIWRNKNLDALKLWGDVFDRLIFNPEYKITTAIITSDLLADRDMPEDTLDGVANFLTSIHYSKIILVLTQRDENTIKGSLRTVYDDIDVSALAQRFGGGGHKKAAGFTINGKLVWNDGDWRIE